MSAARPRRAAAAGRTYRLRWLWAVAFFLGIALGGLRTAPANAGPRLDYVLHCRGCHGPDGAGAPGGAPSFRRQLARFLWVPDGRAYLIRVPGTAQSELSDARVAALLNWMLRAFSPDEIPADFTPYTAAEVRRERRPPLLDVAAARRALLRALAAVKPDACFGPPPPRPR